MWLLAAVCALLTVSVIVFFIIAVLIVSEFHYYTSSQFTFDYDVDKDFQG